MIAAAATIPVIVPLDNPFGLGFETEDPEAEAEGVRAVAVELAVAAEGLARHRDETRNPAG